MKHYIATLSFYGHTRQIVVQGESQQHALDRVWIVYGVGGLRSVKVSESVQYLGVDFFG